jgi:hypothetical protein
MFSKEVKVDIKVTLLFSIPMILYFIAITYRNYNLRNNGTEVEAVIVSFDYKPRTMPSFKYFYCVADILYSGSIGFYPSKIGEFQYGDIITVYYNPQNPKKNYPAIRLFKNNHMKFKIYENEIPLKIKRDIYQRGMWKGWTYDDRLDKFIKKYPFSKEAFPCLPPEYYGEF